MVTINVQDHVKGELVRERSEDDLIEIHPGIGHNSAPFKAEAGTVSELQERIRELEM